MSQFEALGLLPELIHAVQEMQWNLPTTVQDESVPLILGGADVMIAAETGSGKTGAFCLPLLQIIIETLRGDADITQVPESKIPSIPDEFRLSSTDRDAGCAVSEDGTVTQSRDANAWYGCRSTHGITHGKYSYEARVTDEGLCRVGWSTRTGSHVLGTDHMSWGYGGTAKKSHNNVFTDYGMKFGLNDVITCGIDLDVGSMFFSVNGKDLGQAFAIPRDLLGQAFYPAVVMKNAEITFNFGSSPFKFPITSTSPISQAPSEHTTMGKPITTTTTTTTTSSSTSSTTTSSTKKQSRKPVMNSKSPLAIIIEPTMDLAQQVYDEMTKFKKYVTDPTITHDIFVGGGNAKQQEQSLSRGCHIVIGTIGKLMDLIKNGKLDVSQTRYFVLDEADQLIDGGNKNDILSIYELLPKERGMQVIICSATLHSMEITELADRITQNALWVDLKGRDSIPDTVDHAVIMVDPVADRSWRGKKVPTDGIHRGENVGVDSPDSLSQALKILKLEYLIHVINSFDISQAIIFVRTQVDCDNTEQYLIEKGGGGGTFSERRESGKENKYSCCVIHAGRSFQERKTNLDAFRDGDVRFLICTDVAARGIDIKELPFVINVTLPDKPELYIHRVGRVGRAGCPGLAISLVGTVQERVWWHTCNRSDRGRGCTRTKLTAEGGCTIWYDEPDLLEQIETRLGGIEVPHIDYKGLQQGSQHILQKAAAGRAKVDEQSIISSQHIRALQPTALELMKLEMASQIAFIQSKYQHTWTVTR